MSRVKYKPKDLTARQLIALAKEMKAHYEGNLNKAHETMDYEFIDLGEHCRLLRTWRAVKEAAEDGFLFNEWINKRWSRMIMEVEDAVYSGEYDYILEKATHNPKEDK